MLDWFILVLARILWRIVELVGVGLYAGAPSLHVMAPGRGLEPPTIGLTARRSTS